MKKSKQLRSKLPNKTSFIWLITILLNIHIISAQIHVDINLNMKHSVENVSDFGRNRHMTIHAGSTESDWNGEETKLDYLMNELGVYFGRDTGSATWKNQLVEEDPNHKGWPNVTQLKETAIGLKKWIDSPDFVTRRQYRAKSKYMIMGVNDFSPMYPNLSWYPTFGKGKGGWFVRDVDAAAEWTSLYLDNFYAKTTNDIGEGLPKYWECYNEPDMNFMNPSFGMIVSSLEKNWEYHKLVAQKVKERLGSFAPKIGGMTWGQHDFFKPDAVPSRTDGAFWYANSSPEANALYDNMLSGVNGWPKAWDKRKDNWWQWDYLWQGFIDHAGADMDFYGVHLYDWPNSTKGTSTIRSGGHVEAVLDQLEWYDNFKFGKKKDIVMSEFGAVNATYINSLPSRRRDWEFLKPFNQMFLEFLERPSHVVMSMPFSPTKAIWGAYIKSDGNVQRYDGATLFDPIGTWKGNPTTYVMGQPSGGWDWSAIIYYFELWKGVEGTRIDTKSNHSDVQADAYVLGNHVYVILNNCEDDIKTVNLNTFNTALTNTVSNVEMRHLFFDPAKGTQGEPALSVVKLKTAPAQVTLKANSTIVLDYIYNNPVVIDKESKEKKYMSEPLTTAKNTRGTQLCRLEGKNSFTTTVKNVVKPAKGEAVIRIGGFFYNPVDGGDGKIKVVSLKVNGNEVVTQSPMLYNPRGYVAGGYKGGWFGVLELECPLSYLKDGDNTIYFQRQQNADFTTVMIQVWDMDQDPGRTSNTTVALTSVSLGSEAESLMNGNKLGIVPVFAPSNATNKGLVWTSSDVNVATVDENGVVTAKADSGIAVITATSKQTNNIFATKTITAIPYKKSDVTSLEIVQGSQITVDQYVNTPLTLQMTPTPENIPDIEWTSSNDAVVSVLSTGKVIGKVIGGTATITAKVKGTTISDEIIVNVRIAGEESVFSRELPNAIRPFTTGKVTVPVRIMGERTVNMELIKNGMVIGSGIQTVNALGDITIEVPYTLTTAPSPGTGYSIKLTLKNGSTILDTETKTIEVIDHIRVSSVTINEGIPLVQVGKTISRSAVVSPIDAFNTSIQWSSSNSAVATVDQNTGIITGVAVGQVTIRATSVDENTVYAEAVINVQADEVSVPVQSIVLPSVLTLFPSLKKTLTPIFVPSYTTNKNIVWQVNNNIVTVDSNGLVTAGNTEGTAIVTATSITNPSISASVQVKVTKTLVVEAETFVNTGGSTEGVVKSSIGFNNNTSGDWAEYTVDFPASGEYAIKYRIGSPNSAGLGVKIYVDGVLMNTTKLVGTGGWDIYTTQAASGQINISAGVHTIRIESTGTDQWQWNCDWFSLEYMGIVPLSVKSEKLKSVSIYPNPTYGDLVIEGLSNSNTNITIYNLLGVVVKQMNVATDRVDLNISDYATGVYLIKVTKGADSGLYKVIKK
ncbi:Ig-like domain-containing protein [Flavobacterium sp. NG2]|uniref:Ig-like domain-containing protein n=1 Tax=Flavobacterium sp. NG2 TaxID=3097547 RepID=UPI002A815DB8|nr:Ig-like domain-containing protein [Flavobacterium sp. NG2]WPR71842.1 Ig-like domain-containing protein [Flavobacterium sp. NG2]